MSPAPRWRQGPAPAGPFRITAADFPALTLSNALLNLAAVTIGNLIGGGALVAGMYWFIYLRGRSGPA